MSYVASLAQDPRHPSDRHSVANRESSPRLPESQPEPAALWSEHGFALSARWAVGLALAAVPVFTLIGVLLQ